MKKFVCLFVCLFAGSANAGLITQATSVTTSNAPDPAGWGVEHLIDQSGLSSNYVSGVTDFSSFVSTTTAEYSITGASNALGGAATSSPIFYFDMGSIMSLAGLAIWNQSGSASVNIFDLYGSLDGISYSLLGSNFGAPIQSPSAAPAYVASWAAQDMRYVRLDVLTNGGFSGATRFNEIAFDQVSVASVPEPSAFLLLGLGLTGLRFSRKKNAT